MKLHPSVTQSRVIDAVERSTFGTEQIGICLACGEEQDGCEPDARNYVCESCGEKFVYGAEEILFRFVA